MQHPVINDDSLVLWKALGISSWPTLVVLSPQGKVLAQFVGEQSVPQVERFVRTALAFYGDRNMLTHAPVPTVRDTLGAPSLCKIGSSARMHEHLRCVLLGTLGSGCRPRTPLHRFA